VSPPESTLGQYPALTSLRFVAALMVFLFHFPPRGAVWDVVAGEGHSGVSIFFVLSGFLIAGRYAEELAAGTIRLSEYFLRRVARILPLYYAVFILSQLAAQGSISLSWDSLPEWTLTQGLFGESVHHLTIPTSWSLTVEECFYALAPILFLAVAWARRRGPARPLLGVALVLLAVTGVLFGVGVLIWTLLEGRGPGFLRVPKDVTIHTLFGRFYDFALGVLAAQAFSSPAGVRWRQTLDRPAVGALATASASLLILLAQWGMHEAGGIEGPRWSQAWVWNLLLAPAAAGLIVSLTSAANPLARALGAGPLVYLGKISYALYLVQLTPIGKGIFYKLLPRQDGALALFLLYAGLTAVSALLYETVEEPARKLILRLAGRDQKHPVRRPASRLARAASILLLVLAIGGQAVSWAVSSLAERPVTLNEVKSAGARGDDLLAVGPQDVKWGRDALLVGLPRRWKEGWGQDLRAPSALRVFIDGEPVLFARRESDARGPLAFYRGPRAEFLALRVADLPRELLVLRETPFLRARVYLERLLRSPVSLATIAAFSAVALLLGLLVLDRRGLSPQVIVSLALGALLAWWALALHEATWALALVAAECLLLLAIGRRSRRP
jgi:peptidoglycan/LPS O-acetylase OafA/YrhL